MGSPGERTFSPAWRLTSQHFNYLFEVCQQKFFCIILVQRILFASLMKHFFLAMFSKFLLLIFVSGI